MDEGARPGLDRGEAGCVAVLAREEDHLRLGRAVPVSVTLIQGQFARYLNVEYTESMVRLRIALSAAALVSVACGTATIAEHVSTAPSMVRSVAVATAEPGALSAQGGSFVADRGTVLRKVGVSRAQSPAAAPANEPAKDQTPATLPALPSNPCARVGKSAAMCPVGPG